MRRLSMILAAVTLGFGLHLTGETALEAQQPCPDGGEIRFTTDVPGGCGVDKLAPDANGMIPGIMAPGSDGSLHLRFRVTEDGTVQIAGEGPEVPGATLVYLDAEQGTYRTFDLGPLEADTMTQPNVDRIHRWMQTEIDSDVPPEAVLAYLADVDSLKFATRASRIRRVALPDLPRSNLDVEVEEDAPDNDPRRQQSDCEQWVVMTLRTTDFLLIPMVDTKNDTSVVTRSGRRWMQIRGSCWATNPSPIGTTWHTSSCYATPYFWTTRARSRVYHQAYNDDFLLGLGGRHVVRHWVYANFDNLGIRQWPTYSFSNSGPSQGTFITYVVGSHSEGSCR